MFIVFRGYSEEVRINFFCNKFHIEPPGLNPNLAAFTREESISATFLTLPVRRGGGGVGITPQRFFKHNSA